MSEGAAVARRMVQNLDHLQKLALRTRIKQIEADVRHKNWFKPLMTRLELAVTFEVRLFLLLLVVSSALFLLVGSYISSKFQESVYEQVGLRAQVQARAIASEPDLIAAVSASDIPAVARIAQRMSSLSDASYVVVGDRNARHLFHPDPKVAIGSPMVGGDNEEVRKGHSTVTIGVGSLGTALRGKAPIYGQDGQLVGIVSVGYLKDDIFRLHMAQRGQILVFLVGVLFVLFGIAWLFAKSIKKQILDLEPREIALLVKQQEAIFESIMEGVVAVDEQHHVTAINRAAREILGDLRSSAEIIGIPFAALVELNTFGAGMEASKAIRDEIFLFRNIQTIVNRVPVLIEDTPKGWVISFRRKDDISTLSMQLSQIKRYADNLRVIRHEHMNWISTLSGLLQMRYFDEALQLAKMQSETQQRALDFISDAFLNPHLCGLLLGKFYRAKELGLNLEFDPGCRVTELPLIPSISEWMSIIGNLIDNAFDAASSPQAQGKTVTFFMADSADEVIVEVADTGCGIAEALRDHIFERGITSKAGGDHGIGLYLVKTYVEQAGGAITIDDNEPCGTVFSVFVPKGDKHADV